MPEESFLEAGERLLKERGITLEPLEGEKPEEPTKEPEKETPETEEEEVEEETEAEEESEEEEEPETKKPQDTAKQRFKHREGKRREEVDGLKTQISELTDLVKQLAIAKSSEKQEEAKDEIAEFATENGLDADGLKKLVGIIQKQVQPVEKQEEPKPEFNEAEEAGIFNKEWETFEGQIEEQFKNATAIQVKKAKSLMDELSHNENFHDKDLDYIFFKNKEAFEDILFSPKKKSAETSRIGDAEYPEEEFDFEKPVTSSKDAVKAQLQLEKFLDKNKSKDSIHRNGETVVL